MGARILLVAVFLGGCDLETAAPPETPEECVAAGGKVRQGAGALFCDLPATGGYTAAANANARPDDAGAHD